MTNSFGQPAAYYCGGYNCRHRWVQQRGELLANYKNGSKVVAGPGYKEKENETGIAKMRAKALDKRHIVLQKAIGIDGKKSADALENGIKYEYKTISGNSKPETAMQNAIRTAKKQAPFIVTHSNQVIERAEVIKNISLEIRYGKYEFKKVEFWYQNKYQWSVNLEELEEYDG